MTGFGRLAANPFQGRGLARGFRRGLALRVIEAFCVVALDRMQEAGEQDARIEQDPRIARRNSRNPA